MDMQRPLKFDGQYFGIQVDSHFNQCFKEDFINEPNVKLQETTQQNSQSEFSCQIIDRIRCNSNIAYLSINQLMDMARQDLNFSMVNQHQLRRSLWKTKLVEKRNRAKNRKKYRVSNSTVVNNLTGTILVDATQDTKKQKNRLSAQISRDRKKQHYVKLQQENEQLKRTISELNKNNSQLQKIIAKQQEVSKPKNQNVFKTLLIFLGIIFLMNLLKGLPNNRPSKQDDSVSISKIQLNQPEKSFVVQQMKSLGLQIPQQYIQNQKNQLFIDKNLANELIRIKSTLF